MRVKDSTFRVGGFRCPRVVSQHSTGNEAAPITTVPCNGNTRGRIFVELMTSDRKLKAFSVGA